MATGDVKPFTSGQFAAIAAGTDEDWYVVQPHPGTWRLRKLYFVPMTNRTAHDTNYTTLTAKKSSTTLASEATTTSDTGNLVAGTPIELAITGTGANLEFAQGAALKLSKADSGTGLALDGAFYGEWEQVRA